MAGGTGAGGLSRGAIATDGAGGGVSGATGTCGCDSVFGEEASASAPEFSAMISSGVIVLGIGGRSAPEEALSICDCLAAIWPLSWLTVSRATALFLPRP